MIIELCATHLNDCHMCFTGVLKQICVLENVPYFYKQKDYT